METHNLDLSDYAGQYVTIKFLNQSGYGNEMYLDDIGIEGESVGTHDFMTRQGMIIYLIFFRRIFNYLSGSWSGIQVEVLNVLGQVVFEKRTSKRRENINIQNHPAGPTM
jgi:hypothetical protein